MRRSIFFFLCVLTLVVSTRLASAAPIKVACVGDSITQFSHWCEDLSTKLGAGYTVMNYGVSGTTLLKAGDFPYWSTQQFTDSHTFAPDIVVIMLGTNDSKPQNWTAAGKANFVPDYEALIDSYTSLASHPKVYLNLPPPAGTNGYSISGTIIETEQLPLIRQVATAKGTGLIDIFTAFGGHNFDASLYGSAGDQVHPNDKGGQLICDTVYAALMGTSDAGQPTDSGGTKDATNTDASGGSGGSTGTGGLAPKTDGAAGSPATGGTIVTPDAGTPADESAAPESSSGCGCRTAGGATTRSAWAASLLLAALAIRRKNRHGR
jgi:MYXO-CTERM domain-containing protein